jgi:hypothetical protein
MQSCGFNKEGFGDKKPWEGESNPILQIQSLLARLTSQQLCQRQSETARPNQLIEQFRIDEL